jgi:hypothetical protein
MKKIFSMTQQMRINFISLGFAIGCLMLYFFFPIGEYKFEIAVGAFSFLFILPVLYIKFVLKRPVSDMGLTSFKIDISSTFYLVSAIVLGGLFSFFVFTLQWGVQKYLLTLSPTILQDFRAFAIYELFFTSIALFLITFFSWGFVYAIKWRNTIYSFITAFIAFNVLLVDFYSSFWVALPFLIPTLFVQKIRDDKNIFYLFVAVYMIALIFDTLIVKSFR